MNLKALKFSTIFAIALAAAGCGGGGGDTSSTSTPATTAQGLWNGTTSTKRSMTGLILSDGSYWVLYSAVSNPNVIAGVIQGNGTSSSGAFTSSNAKDFNLEGFGVLPATVSATYAAKQSFNGSLAYTGASTTFTSTYDATGEQTPALSNLAGTFSGQVALSVGIQSATITVSASGAVSGTNSGCAISGSVIPRTDLNAYNFSMSFGAAPCLFANQSFSGIAYFNAATKRLYAAAPNAARTDGVLFVGTKP